ncbi:MAG: hypothetical protein NVSMB47_09800 [Polyangiales bacterium]
MIVWGGGASGDGARYDPIRDTWQAVSPKGAPTVRGGHSAVWTGTEMIVYGGVTGDPVTPLGDGGRYTP